MKRFMKEFKEFALRGNVMDLAIGVVIGGAFSAIVTSLVNDIISPLIGLFVKINFSELAYVHGEVTIAYGAFLMAIVNFLIVALVLFCVIKGINGVRSKNKNVQEEAAPQTKVCPYCKSEIPVEASRCPHCTSTLEE